MKKYVTDNPRMDSQIRILVLGIGIIVSAIVWLTVLLGLIKF
jgi:hypothetical protein